MKKKKVGVIAGSVAAIAVCSSMIVGSTLALFTGEDKVNIAVTSGNVEVTAAVVENSIQSKQLNAGWAEGGDNTYAKAVTVSGNSITLNKFVPGDAVKFDISVENKSNITVKYRTKIFAEADTGLFAGLNITLNEVEYNGFTKYSPWTELQPDSEIDTVSISLELPEKAGNEFKNKSATIVYVVEAVQGNATTIDEIVDENVIPIYTASDLRVLSKSVTAENHFNGKIVKLMNNIDLENVPFTTIGASVEDKTVNYFGGIFDGNNKTISNLYINAVDENGNGLYGTKTMAGLFGDIHGQIKNLTLDGVEIRGVHWVGAIAGYATDHCGAQIIGCTVKNAKLSATPELLDNKYDNGDKIGGIMGYMANGGSDSSHDNFNTINNCHVENVEISGYRHVGGLVGYADVALVDCTAKGVKLTQDFTNGYKPVKDITGLVDGLACFGSSGSSENSSATNVTITYIATNTEEAQAAIDNAADNTTVLLRAGEYEQLSFRPSNRSVEMDRAVTPWNHMWLQRSIKNLTIKGENGVVVNGFTLSGALYNNGDDNRFLNPATNDYTCFYSNSIVDGLTISDITFNAGINIDVLWVHSSEYYPNEVKNVLIENCKTTDDDYRDVKYNNATGKLVVFNGGENITVRNCEVTNRYQGVYCQVVKNAKVEGCKFSNITHNAIAFQSAENKYSSGELVIKNNIIDNDTDRPFRFGVITDSTTKIIIEGNTITNSGDNGSYCKVGSNVGDLAEGVVVNVTNNYWDKDTTNIAEEEWAIILTFMNGAKDKSPKATA